MTHAEHIIGRIVEDEKQHGLGQTVDQFGKSVEEKAAEYVERVTNELGEGARDLVGDVIAEARSYRQARNELLDPHAKVEDAKKHGAAAYVHRKTKEKTFDKDAMGYDLGALEDYWSRVEDHETVHQKNQALDYSMQRIEYFVANGRKKSASVIGNLTERQAIRKSGQPNADLTPDYVEHAEIGDEVSAIAGESVFDAALAPGGDIAELQKVIMERQQQQFLELYMDGETVSGESN